MGNEKREILKKYFETGKIPTQSNFEELINSTVIKSDDEFVERGKSGFKIYPERDGKYVLDIYDNDTHWPRFAVPFFQLGVSADRRTSSSITSSTLFLDSSLNDKIIEIQSCTDGNLFRINGNCTVNGTISLVRNVINLYRNPMPIDLLCLSLKINEHIETYEVTTIFYDNNDLKHKTVYAQFIVNILVRLDKSTPVISSDIVELINVGQFGEKSTWTLKLDCVKGTGAHDMKIVLVQCPLEFGEKRFFYSIIKK